MRLKIFTKLRLQSSQILTKTKALYNKGTVIIPIFDMNIHILQYFMLLTSG